MKKKGNHVKSRYVLLMMTIVCVVMIMLGLNKLLPVKPVRDAVGTVFVPIQTGINKVGDWLNGQRVGHKNARQLAQENSQLQEKVNELQEQNTVLQENSQELSRLRQLYNLDEDYSQYDKVAAEVVSKDPGNWYNTFTINRGSDAGIEKDMNVISDGGLVGLVTDVGPNWAKVRSIIDDESRVSAMLLTTSENCIVSGDLSLIDKGKLRLSQLTADAKATVGERVVTSNISDKYLPGILIGYLDSVEDDSNRLTQNGYVIPVVDFQNVQDVLVIKELKNNGGAREGNTPETAAENESVQSVSSSSESGEVSQ